ncbi:MAG: hypothetical protein ACK5P6_05380 [Pseudobdellovibrionaceae bacterium]|jgi:tetratricopeptide (TPR) repeat protein
MKKILLIMMMLGLPSFSAQADDLLGILEGQNSAVVSPKKQKINTYLSQLIGQPTAEQNIFMQFFAQEDYRKALYQWPSAFAKNPFAQTANGKALYNFLLFKNGLEVIGLEALLTQTQPQSISSLLTEEWRKTATADHRVWLYLPEQAWKKEWTSVFGLEAHIRMSSKAIFQSKDLARISELKLEIAPESNEFAWLTWQEVLLTIPKDATKAAQALAQLMKLKQNVVNEELLNITAARLLYARGFLDAAIKYYEKVPKKSDLWFEAQEEMAWSFLRKGEPQNSIAISKSITLSEFLPLAGPESLYVRTIAELKTCQYERVISNLQQFKMIFKPRFESLNQVASSASNEPSDRLALAMKKAIRIGVQDLKGVFQAVPRFALRDQVLRNIVNTELKIEAEAKIAGDLYAASLTEGTAQVGFQASMESFKQMAEQRLQQVINSRHQRVRTLASREMTEIQSILKKMHIVEAEVLSQSTLAHRVASASETVGAASLQEGTTGSKDLYALKFQGTQEVWFDEISNYKVSVEGACKGGKR